jgi:hypothetical protein
VDRTIYSLPDIILRVGSGAKARRSRHVGTVQATPIVGYLFKERLQRIKQLRRLELLRNRQTLLSACSVKLQSKGCMATMTTPLYQSGKGLSHLDANANSGPHSFLEAKQAARPHRPSYSSNLSMKWRL